MEKDSQTGFLHSVRDAQYKIDQALGFVRWYAETPALQEARELLHVTRIILDEAYDAIYTGASREERHCKKPGDPIFLKGIFMETSFHIVLKEGQQHVRVSVTRVKQMKDVVSFLEALKSFVNSPEISGAYVSLHQFVNQLEQADRLVRKG